MKIQTALLIATVGITATAGIAGTSHVDYVYSIKNGVNFVYTDQPCPTHKLPVGTVGMELVSGYAINLVNMTKAEGCVALYKKQSRAIAEFRLKFIDKDGVPATLDHVFLQSLFEKRDRI